jgi:hypothetical protein
VSVNTWYQCITPERLEQLLDDNRFDRDAPAKYLDSENENDRFGKREPRLWTERNWLGLYSLLTFGEWAEQPLLGQSIAGGTPIGNPFCYDDSPVRYFRMEQVHAIAAALQEVKEEALRRTCDPAVLNAARVEPIGEWRDGDFPHLWKTFCDIRNFFRTASEQEYAVLVYLC